MDNIMDTLITDRAQADVDRAKYLNSLWDARAGRWRGTPEEWAEWAAGPRGAYGFNDMNRVNEAVAYLTGVLAGMGYTVAVEGVVPAYNIRVGVEPDGGGIASGSGVFFEGDTVTVSAQAGEKYDFTGWFEAGEMVSADLVYTFTAERSRNLTAVFALKQFRVDVGVDPAGSGEATGGGVYDIDTEVTVAAEVGDGYAFTRWMENGGTAADGPECPGKCGAVRVGTGLAAGLGTLCGICGKPHLREKTLEPVFTTSIHRLAGSIPAMPR